MADSMLLITWVFLVMRLFPRITNQTFRSFPLGVFVPLKIGVSGKDLNIQFR